MLQIVYLWIPIVNVCVTTYLIFDPNLNLEDQPIFSYVVFYTVLCCHRVFDFFTAIRRSVIDDARYFMSLKELGEEECIKYLKQLKANKDSSV